VDGAVRELEGELARLVVARTFPLSDGTGLVVTRDAAGATRTFRARATGFEELRGWRARRVLDVVEAREHGTLLVLAGDGSQPERFAVHGAALGAPDRLAPLLALEGEPPSALALWEGRLFVGTSAGRILRALPAGTRP